MPPGLRAQRPRLLATPADIAALPARLAGDAVGRRWRDALLREAERLLRQPPVERRFEERRPVLLPTSREVLKRVENLGVAWLLTSDRRFAARIGAELDAACAFPSWNPSHFLDVAEMAMAVSLAVDWCHDALDPAIRARAIDRLVAYALEPGLAEFRRSAFWTRATHNWALVCAGGLVAASIAAAEAAPELAGTVLDASIATARAAFASYGPDGGWDRDRATGTTRRNTRSSSARRWRAPSAGISASARRRASRAPGCSACTWRGRPACPSISATTRRRRARRRR